MAIIKVIRMVKLALRVAPEVSPTTVAFLWPSRFKTVLNSPMAAASYPVTAERTPKPVVPTTPNHTTAPTATRPKTLSKITSIFNKLTPRVPMVETAATATHLRITKKLLQPLRVGQIIRPVLEIMKRPQPELMIPFYRKEISLLSISSNTLRKTTSYHQLL